MEEKIRDLHQKVQKIINGYLIYQKRDNIEQMKKIVPQIQEYVLWFMEENKLNINQEKYQELKNNLIFVLEDILEAMEQGDRVLLNDALAWDFVEYLKLSEMK